MIFGAADDVQGVRTALDLDRVVPPITVVIGVEDVWNTVPVRVQVFGEDGDDVGVQVERVATCYRVRRAIHLLCCESRDQSIGRVEFQALRECGRD